MKTKTLIIEGSKSEIQKEFGALKKNGRVVFVGFTTCVVGSIMVHSVLIEYYPKEKA